MSIPTATGDFVARNREIHDRFMAGEKEADIARAYGITRERVRQLLNVMLGPGEKQRVMGGFGGSCRVCLGPILRGQKYVTCSPECGGLFGILRRYLSAGHRDRMRLAQARRILRTGDSGGRRWAERVINGQPLRTGELPQWAKRDEPRGGFLLKAWRRVQELRAAKGVA